MKIVKRISKWLFWIILVLVALYSVIIIFQKLIWKDKTPSIFGYKNFIVLTGSMEPTLNIGDIVITKETTEIQEQDIISFREKNSNSVITHRVVEIKEKNEKIIYITKGDANSGNDTELLSIENIEGKYSFKIPFVGKIILFLQKPIGMIILCLIFSIFLMIESKKIKKIPKHSKRR